MPTFTAIDFETAHPKPWSICQVGLVRFENGEIVKELDMLIQPPDNFYWDKFIQIHGITSEDTRYSPTFYEAWPEIRDFIEGNTVVAHNGAFDFKCLAHSLNYYGMDMVNYTPKCTYKIYKKGLAFLCEKYAIPLNHHDALSDARACAELYRMHLNQSD